MSLESGIYTLLKDDAGVAALVGDRIYPDILPMDIQLPAITHQIGSGIAPGLAHDGDIDLDTVGYQLTLWDSNRDDVILLREAVRSVASGFRGTVDGEKFDRIAIDNMLGPFADELNLHQIVMDLSILHRRS